MLVPAQNPVELHVYINTGYWLHIYMKNEICYILKMV